MRIGYPPNVNDPDAIRQIRSVTSDLVGSDHIVVKEQTMGAEDFAYMAQQAKGGFVHIGAAIGDKFRPHHHPEFDIDESILSTGAAILAETAKRYLERR